MLSIMRYKEMDILLPIILSIFIKQRETDSYEKAVGKGKFQYGAKGQELFNNKKFVKNFERIRLKTNQNIPYLNAFSHFIFQLASNSRHNNEGLSRSLSVSL